MSTPFDDISAQERSPDSRVLVLSNQASRRSELANHASGMGFQVSTGQLNIGQLNPAAPGIPPSTTGSPSDEKTGSWAEVDTVVLVAEETGDGWHSLVEAIRQEAAAPPLVVLGPAAGATWRGRALTAGAFVCGSLEAPAEELRSLLSAAILYRSLEKEINLLRVECERICLGLLKSYGQAAASLKDSNEEVHAVQESLREIRNRIIRAFV